MGDTLFIYDMYTYTINYLAIIYLKIEMQKPDE